MNDSQRQTRSEELAPPPAAMTPPHDHVIGSGSDCITDSSAADGSASPSAPAVATTLPAADEPHPWRTLKLVVTVQPVSAEGYRAVLAVGADGAAPMLQVVAVADLPAALVAVQRLVAAAEEQWRSRPHAPATVALRPGDAGCRLPAVDDPPRPTAGTPAGPSATDPEAPLDLPVEQSIDTRSGRRARPGQLSLFGCPHGGPQS